MRCHARAGQRGRGPAWLCAALHMHQQHGVPGDLHNLWDTEMNKAVLDATASCTNKYTKMIELLNEYESTKSKKVKWGRQVRGGGGRVAPCPAHPAQPRCCRAVSTHHMPCHQTHAGPGASPAGAATTCYSCYSYLAVVITSRFLLHHFLFFSRLLQPAPQTVHAAQQHAHTHMRATKPQHMWARGGQVKCAHPPVP